MKSRGLKTIHDLIVRDYKIEPIGDGKFLHSFKPATTETTYQFVANRIPEVVEGERYNIGYYEDDVGNKIIERSCLSKNTEVNPMLSYLYATQLSSEKHDINKAKNDERVSHTAQDGYYWGKKYAWREFGLVIPKDAFYSYLDEIIHPQVECITRNPDKPFNNEKSIAYKEDGIADAINALIASAEKKTKVKYKSPLYSRQFTIRGIEAITDKK
ncbi:hypothetical protein [uncultured Sulfuricurvum sp.]|uniref:hypothetical protein n=1 Tax=uncultured Sulfuricurvum sp. TaxID=430693 RepID=UPI0026050170|nr:hypothetical protein [uncultured Sulfuricurvum sp.]